jgi:ferredoxin
MPKLRAEDEDEKGKKTTGNWKKQGLASLEKGKKTEEVTEKNAERSIHKAEFDCPTVIIRYGQLAE